MLNFTGGSESRTQASFIELLGHAKSAARALRAQAHAALDAGHITQSQFDQLVDPAEKCSRQISRFLSFTRPTL